MLSLADFNYYPNSLNLRSKYDLLTHLNSIWKDFKREMIFQRIHKKINLRFQHHTKTIAAEKKIISEIFNENFCYWLKTNIFDLNFMQYDTTDE